MLQKIFLGNIFKYALLTHLLLMDFTFVRHTPSGNSRLNSTPSTDFRLLNEMFLCRMVFVIVNLSENKTTHLKSVGSYFYPLVALIQQICDSKQMFG